jgi:hypothetical protein
MSNFSDTGDVDGSGPDDPAEGLADAEPEGDAPWREPWPESQPLDDPAPDPAAGPPDDPVSGLPAELELREAPSLPWDDGLEAWLEQTAEPQDPVPAADPTFAGQLGEVIAGDLAETSRSDLVERVLDRALGRPSA